jgi:hypothetical protein
MKKIVTIICLLFILLNFTSCAELISTDYEDVEVLVIDKYHRGIWLQPIRINNRTTYITHPETWSITVEYEGEEYTISGHDTYDKYKNKIGQTTTGTLEIKTYDDETVKYDIIGLEE